jgi:preprotein translocase subunit YajC
LTELFAFLQHTLVTLAQEGVAPGGGTPLPGGGPPPDASGEMIKLVGMLVAMGIVFWLLLIRPESKRRKEREQVLNAIKPKDRVVTIGGLYGTVVEIEKDEIVLLVDPKKDIKLRFRRGAIDSVEESADSKK